MAAVNHWRGAIGLALFAAVTVASSAAEAFRTTSDLPQFAGAGPVVWSEARFDYVVNAEVPYGLELSPAKDAIVDAAFEVMSAECSDVSLSLSSVSESSAVAGDGLNTVQWITDWEQRGFAPGAGAADIQYEKQVDGTWSIVECDVYLRSGEYQWNTVPESSAEKVDVKSVVLHEFLHCLGIEHRCERDGSGEAPVCTAEDDASGSVMLPEHEGRFAELSADDEAALCHLYPQPPCEEAGCWPGFECREGTCQQQCGERWCPAEQLCQDDKCVDLSEAGAGAAEPCVSNDDCPDSLSCDAGACVAGDRQVGDPCGDNRECSDSICTDRGYCASSCSVDQNCISGSCRDGVCLDLRAPFGGDCGEATDCISELCLDDGPNKAYCTRQCAGPSCPAGWRCDFVDQVAVCVPKAEPSEGCSIRGRGPARPGGFPIISSLAAAVALMLASRRKQRLSRSHRGSLKKWMER